VSILVTNLTGADLGETALEGAWLRICANLTEVESPKDKLLSKRALQTCIEAWNIDSTTQLRDVFVITFTFCGQQGVSLVVNSLGDFYGVVSGIIHARPDFFLATLSQKAFNYSCIASG